MTPSCWNHWRTATTPLHRSSAVQNFSSTWTYCYVLTVIDCLLSSSNQNGPMMPCLEMATQGVHFKVCNGLCRQCSGGVLPQKMLEVHRELDPNVLAVPGSSFGAHFLSASETKSFCSTDSKLWRCLLHRLDLM